MENKERKNESHKRYRKNQILRVKVWKYTKVSKKVQDTEVTYLDERKTLERMKCNMSEKVRA